MRTTLLFLLFAAILTSFAGAQTQPWVSAYYAGWMQDGYPPSAVDFGAMTHVIHFSLEPGNGGTISGAGNGITPAASQALVSAAHAAGKKAIITVGGWGADGGFVNATNSTNRATFVSNLVNFIKTYNYDGIDIDWEPVTSPAQFKLFIPELRSALNSAKPGALLTIAVMGTDQAVIDMQSYFDQINIMTYDMSGAWSGWVTWHNSPIYDGGARFPETGELLPSANGSIDEYLAKGVPKAKLGIGTDFYGYVWSGVSQPREAWTTAPSVTGNVSYASLMNTYGSNTVSWDAAAGAAYISITSPSKKFVSLDNEQTIDAKATYVRNKGIGGIIIWELGGGYRPTAPAGYRDALLQAVKRSFMSGTVPTGDSIAPVVSISAPLANATVSGSISVTAQATDAVGVAGVQFKVDGAAVGVEALATPYTTTINTWQYANGQHTLSAIARDWAGNSATASITITVNNQGTPPSVPALVVFNDALQSPFADASWSATVNFSSTSPVMSGTKSIKVTYDAWGGLDLLSGDWDSEIPIDPATYDTLRFDVYPTASFPLTVGFYSSTVDVAAPPANRWTTISVPTPPDPFTRFYIANNTGNSQVASFDNIRFTGQNSSPALPSNAVFVSPQAGATAQPTTLTLRWRAAADATKYHLQLATDSLYATLVVNDSTLTDTLRQVTGLLGATRYHRRVRAGNAAGWSVFTGTASFTTQGLMAPTLVSPANGVVQQPLSVPLSWNPSAGATTFQLEIALDAGFASRVLTDSTLTNPARTVGPLARKTWYFWRVRAKGPQLTSAFSPVWKFRTVTSVPKTPRTLSVTAPTSSSTDSRVLIWESSEDADLYRLQISTDSLFTNPSIDTTCTDSSVTVRLTTPPPSYYARVRAESDAGVSDYTAPLRFSLVTTGARSDVHVSDFALYQNYPNPFNPSTMIEFDIPVQSAVSLRIYNMLGEEVATLAAGSFPAGRHTVAWNAAGFASGTYFCRFEAGTYTTIRRLTLLK